jgi:hypothetical protein
MVRALPRLYLWMSGYCIIYWLIMNGPYTTEIIGTDGSGFIILGTLSLFILPLFIIGWFFSSVREVVISKYGKKLSFVCLAIISTFFLWGTSIWMSLFIYGI